MAEAAKARAEAAKVGKLQNDFSRAVQSGDAKKVIAAADAAIEFKPMFERFVGPMKFAALIKLDEQDKALDYGKKLLASEIGKEPQGLNGLGVGDRRPRGQRLKPNAKLLALAVESAKKADELVKEKDPAIADTLAKAYFDSGNVAKAVETQERAVKLAKGTQFEDDKMLVERLEQYKKAAAK